LEKLALAGEEEKFAKSQPLHPYTVCGKNITTLIINKFATFNISAQTGSRGCIGAVLFECCSNNNIISVHRKWKSAESGIHPLLNPLQFTGWVHIN